MPTLVTLINTRIWSRDDFPGISSNISAIDNISSIDSCLVLGAELLKCCLLFRVVKATEVWLPDTWRSDKMMSLNPIQEAFEFVKL